MDCIVHGVAKSWTRLSHCHSTALRNLKPVTTHPSIRGGGTPAWMKTLSEGLTSRWGTGTFHSITEQTQRMPRKSQ